MLRQRTTGDQRFETLVAEHADAVWRFAMSMLRHHADADDVTQETFLRAYRSLDGFRGESSTSTWVLTICRNLCVDHLRRRREVPDLQLVHDAPPAHDHADGVAVRAALEHGLQDLADEEREAFVLVDVLGFSGTEAAEVCGVPATTLRSRRQRAHEHLAGLLTGEVG